MKEDAFLLAYPADGFDVLNRAHLLIAVLYTDEKGFIPDALLELIQIDESLFIGFQPGQLVSLLLQPLTRVQHGVVLDSGAYNVIFLAGHGLCCTLQRQVIGFCSPGSEYDLFGGCVQLFCDDLSGVIQSLPGLNPRRMTELRGSHGIRIREIRHHRLDDIGIGACRRCVIQIYSLMFHAYVS